MPASTATAAAERATVVAAVAQRPSRRPAVHGGRDDDGRSGRRSSAPSDRTAAASTTDAFDPIGGGGGGGPWIGLAAENAAAAAVLALQSLRFPPPGLLLDELAGCLADFALSVFESEDERDDLPKRRCPARDLAVTVHPFGIPMDLLPGMASDLPPPPSSGQLLVLDPQSENSLLGLYHTGACLTAAALIPLPSLHEFVLDLITHTELLTSTVALALLLLVRLASRTTARTTTSGAAASLFPGEPGTAHRLAFLAVVVAAKLLYDDSYDNSAWCGGAAARLYPTAAAVSRHELAFLALLNFDLHVTRRDWDEFLRAAERCSVGDTDESAALQRDITPLVRLAHRTANRRHSRRHRALSRPKGRTSEAAVAITVPGGSAPLLFALIYDDAEGAEPKADDDAACGPAADFTAAKQTAAEMLAAALARPGSPELAARSLARAAVAAASDPQIPIPMPEQAPPMPAVAVVGPAAAAAAAAAAAPTASPPATLRRESARRARRESAASVPSAARAGAEAVVPRARAAPSAAASAAVRRRRRRARAQVMATAAAPAAVAA
ncbi:hypothetical protein HK405_009714 [Cladochytrium tenue]|nr:hypothetical protein HK405_009714 [Cladochytrium tenue]